MRFWLAIPCLGLLVACPASRPASVDGRVRDLGVDAADDGRPPADGARDRMLGETVPARLGFVAPASLQVPVGQHALVGLEVTPAGRALQTKLSAPPCRLKLVGETTVPQDVLPLSLPGGGAPPPQLVVFAPLQAPPQSSCPLQAEGGSGPALTFSVVDPTYVAIDFGDHAISLLEGLEATTIGDLGGTTAEVQALTFAGGSFNGEFVAVRGDAGDSEVNTSYVQLYRFKAQPAGTPQPAATLQPWIDLAGKATNPTAVEDLVWSPQGPCPLGPDALYLAAPTADAALSGGVAGGVYCIDVNKQWATVVDAPARALDVDVLGTFHPNLGQGTLFVARWGGHYTVPPGTSFSDPALPTVANRWRFARAGPHAGSLYAISTGFPGKPSLLSRVSPAPHQAQALAIDLAGRADLALSHGGTFGELVLLADETVPFVSFDLVALLEQTGGVRRLPLARWLRCGQRVAFDRVGQTLAVVTASSGGCKGKSTVHTLRFALP